MTKPKIERSTGISFAFYFIKILKLIFMQNYKAKKSKGQVSNQSKRIEGKYANYFKIGHNAFEFVIDFGQLYHKHGKEHFHTRIITSPIYAKALLETLGKSIEQYRETYGTNRR